jgi:serine/threonine-protein kinase RsbT
MSPTAGGTVMSVAGEDDVPVVLLRVGEEADRAGLGPADRARVMTAASELARNIVKYAGRGSLTVRSLKDGRRSGLEIVAEDRGPGIADVEAALTDHFSTGGTLGLGLPGVRRMMDEFEMRTAPGAGTRVAVRKWAS